MYYVGKNGHQTGPFTLEELRKMVHKDELHVDTLVWEDGAPAWQQAGTLPGLFASAAVPPPPLGFSPPGAQATHGYPPPTFEEVPNYLLASVLVTVFFFPFSLFGIAAIRHASRVNNLMMVGDVAAAKESARKARLWCWVTVITGALAFAGSSYYVYLEAQRQGWL